MQRSKIVVPVHLVWATYQRLPLIRVEWKEELYAQIQIELTKLRVDSLAIGGVADHIHLAIRLPATRTVAEIMKQLKGASSHFLGEKLRAEDGFFKWQEGYGAFGFHVGLTSRIISYIENQETHHARNDLWPALEAMEEDSLVREDADKVGYAARDFSPSCLTQAAP
jgi:REP element-mobilizing transposase RayT